MAEGMLGNTTANARRKWARWLPLSRRVATAMTLFVVATPQRASADAYGITHPRQHIDYSFELEPEVVIVFNRPLNEGPGLGVRGSVPVLFNGFVPSINNSVALSFGIDKDPLAKGNHINVPLALQWNFWLARNFSVFGEPGVLLQFADRTEAHPEIWGGARLHFGESVALTGRLSLPTVPAMSIGVSFFF